MPLIMTRSLSGIDLNGPYVIGYTLCFGLMGALAVQAYIYYTRFTDDRKAIKALVTIVLFLETLMTVLTFYGFWAASTLDDYISLNLLIDVIPISWWFVALAPISGLVTTLTHGFFCWRIAILGKPRLISLLIMMVSLLQLSSIIYLDFTDDLAPSIQTVLEVPLSYVPVTYSPQAWIVTWLGSSVVCDLAITICMMLCLRPSNSRFASNKSTLVKLTRLTIETGFVTTVAALLELVLALVFVDTFYHLAVFYTISKLYANSLLASLNFRLVLRSQSDPNLTAIVWDDMLNAQSRQLGSQTTHGLQLEAGDMAIDSNKASFRNNSSIEDQDQACV